MVYLHPVLLLRPCGRAAAALGGRGASPQTAAALARKAVATAAAAPPTSSSRHAACYATKSDLVRSIRAMPIKLLRVSKDNSRPAQELSQEWLTKLSRYTAVTEHVVKPNPKGAASTQVQKDAEAEKVLKAIAPGDRVILLDERGRDASSEDMARLLIKASDDGTPLCFVIGGPFGHGAAVTQRADESVRLSRMVLNHSVAYIVLVEQLYRAWTIVRGFNPGASCWVSTDIVAGKTNHESGANFNFQPGGQHCYYVVSGGSLTPSWGDANGCGESADPDGLFSICHDSPEDTFGHKCPNPTPCGPNLVEPVTI